MIPRKRKPDALQVVSLKGPKSNTAPSNLIGIRAGLDWLQLSFYGRNIPTTERKALAELRERALSGEENEYLIGGVPFVVQPYGFGVGVSHMRYVVKGDGLTVGFSQRDESPERGGPVMTITAPGSWCTGRDPLKIYEDLKTLAAVAGCAFERVSISRVDIHVDVDGLRVSDVVEKIEAGKVVARAKRFNVSGAMNGEIETFYLGSVNAHTRLCVYDKVAELLKDPLKAKRYFERWGIRDWPESCTRYEWRLDGDAIRENHGFRNASEFFRSLKTVVRYLVRDWYRESDEVIDRNNTEKMELSQGWKEITETALNFFEGTAPRRAVVKPLPVAEELLKQAAGCLASAAACLGVLPEDAFNAAEFFQTELSSCADLFREKVKNGISRIRSVWGDIFSAEDLRKRREALEGLTFA